MKTKLIFMVLAVVVLSTGISFGQSGSFTLDNISGTMLNDTSFKSTETYDLNFRLTNGSTVVTGITNGFKIYSDDGATWTTSVGSATAEIEAFFTFSTIAPFSISGSAADTIGFNGVFFGPSGVPPNYDNVAYTITIGPIPEASAGKSICVDSAYYPPSGTWKWAYDDGGVQAIFPEWDGPHCYWVDVETGINGVDNLLPATFSLAQNYPNPFNPSTTISYDLPRMSDVNLTIYNVTGQKVTEFNEANKVAGANHTFKWDASAQASGIYFYKLTAGDYTDTKKMMLLK